MDDSSGRAKRSPSRRWLSESLLAVAPLLLGVAAGCVVYDSTYVLQPVERDASLDRDAGSARCKSDGEEACDAVRGEPDASGGDSPAERYTGLDSPSADQSFERVSIDDGSTDVVDDFAVEDIGSERPADVGHPADIDRDITDSGDGEAGPLDVIVGIDTFDVSDEEAGRDDAKDATAPDISDVARPPTFYRAINVGGSTATALVIDGNTWEAGLTASNVTYSTGTDAAGSGGLASVTNIPLIPTTDTSRTSMIQNFAWGRPVTFTMSNVPSGQYTVYIYTWEDNGAQTFNIILQGQTVLAGYNSGANGHWEKLGPWPIDVSAGTISIATSPLTGPAFAHLCGVEIWRQ